VYVSGAVVVNVVKLRTEIVLIYAPMLKIAIRPPVCSDSDFEAASMICQFDNKSNRDGPKLLLMERSRGTRKPILQLRYIHKN